MSYSTPMKLLAFFICLLPSLPALAVPAATPSANACYTAGLDCLHARDWSGALTNFTRAIELDPRLADAYAARGFATMAQGIANWNPTSSAAAIPDYNRFLELKPKATNAFKICFYSAMVQTDPNLALPQFTRAIMLKSDYAPPYVGRGCILFFKNDLAGALKDFNRAISLSPDDPRVAGAYWGRAQILEKQGDPTAAKADRDHAKALMGPDPVSLVSFP